MKEITDFIRDLGDCGGKTIILFGEEAQLIEEAREIIRRQVNTDNRERGDMETLSASPMVENRGDALFGGGAYLYEVVGYGTPSAAALAALHKISTRLTAPDVLCVAIYGVLRKSYKDAWLRDLSALGVSAVASPQNAAATAAWCRRWLAAWQISLADESIQWLAAQTEGNLAAAKQCLYKIRLNGETGADDMDKTAAALSGGARYNIFQLTEAALAGKGKQSLAILNVLLDIQEPPPLILWAVGNAVGGLLAAKRGAAPGWGLPQQAIRDIAKRASESEIIHVLKRAAHADRVIKGIEQGDIKIALTDAVAGLACLRRGNTIPTPSLQVD